MRILHCADFHVRDKDIDECRKVLAHLVNYAHSRVESLDLIVIAGDLTDRNDVRMDSATARLVIQTVSSLSEVAPVAILGGTKSHDGNIPEILSMVKSYMPVHVSMYPEQVVLSQNDGFVAPYDIEDKEPLALLSFIPTPTKQYFSQQGDIEYTDQAVGEAMGALFANFGANAAHLDSLPHILIGHWQVGGSYISETQQLVGRDIEISVDQILSARPTLACLGHIHMRQQIRNYPFFYPGSLYAKDFGELDPKGFYVHTIGTDRSVIPDFIQGPSRKLVKVAHNFTVTGDDIRELDAVLYSVSVEDIAGAHVRVELQVWQDERESLDRAEIERFYLSAGAESVDVRIVPVPRQNARAQRVLEVRRLREKIEARAEITGDSLTDGILAKADAIEETDRENLISEIKEVA